MAVPAGAKDKKDEVGVPDKDLQKKIDKAIDKGGEYLRTVQRSSGMIGSVHHQKAAHYEIGTTALAGLALLAAGDKPGRDPDKPSSVDLVLKYCKRKDLERGQSGGRTTYEA